MTDAPQPPEDLQTPEGEQQELPPMAHVRALLRPVNVGVGKMEDSDERLLIVGPFMLELHVPLPPDLARAVAQHLSGGVVIASARQMPGKIEIPGVRRG